MKYDYFFLSSNWEAGSRFTGKRLLKIACRRRGVRPVRYGKTIDTTPR